jgi:hypothetical protein
MSKERPVDLIDRYQTLNVHSIISERLKRRMLKEANAEEGNAEEGNA